ncbi:MAG: HNH endonuclease [Spirochaetia bacterium]|nr:HNH endonuclease [Spirochaetia bacterium]
MSRAERKTFEISETKEEVFNRDGWTCQVCGRNVNQSTGQLAHLIPQSKAMLNKYGKQIIHHPDNMLTTCSLRCNNAVQLNIPMMQEQLARGIRKAIEIEPVG